MLDNTQEALEGLERATAILNVSIPQAGFVNLTPFRYAVLQRRMKVIMPTNEVNGSCSPTQLHNMDIEKAGLMVLKNKPEIVSLAPHKLPAHRHPCLVS